MSHDAGVVRDDAFWLRISTRLRHLARARGVCADAADDVVQETVRAALEGLQAGRFSGAGNLEGWIYGIFVHKLTDLARASQASAARLVQVDRGGRNREGHDERNERGEGGDSDARLRARDASDPETVAIVEDVLARLPPRERAALLFKYLAGLTAREFAPLLGLRPATASDLLTRAKQRFAGLVAATPGTVATVATVAGPAAADSPDAHRQSAIAPASPTRTNSASHRRGRTRTRRMTREEVP